jgi:hypothetical protein
MHPAVTEYHPGTVSGRARANFVSKAHLRFILTLMTALILSWPSPAASAVSVTAYAPLNDLFHAYGDSGSEWKPGDARVWTGGDSTFSVVLPDGRTVWIFSDTFLSPNSGCAPSEPQPCHRRQLFVAPLVNNTFVTQSGADLTATLYGGTDASPTALIRPPVPNDLRSHYWMGDGIVEGDKLHVFVHRYPLTPGTIPPSAEATDVATFSLPTLTLDGISEGISPIGGIRPWAFLSPPVGSVVPVTWGAAILEDGPYSYVYGTEEYPLHKFLHVARVPTGQLLTGDWEYYTGSGWSENPLLSSRTLDNVAGEMSVVKTTTGYRLVASLLGIGDILAYEGPSPEGPWGSPTMIYSPPEASSSGFAYNAKEHPQLAHDGTTVISYNVNGQVDGKDAFQDIHVYRPRFLEVSGLTPVAGTTNLPPLAIDDRAETRMNTSVRLGVLSNDSDPDGDPLSVVEISRPSNGTATINEDYSVTYRPRLGFRGTDSFTYMVEDGRGGSDSASVTIEVDNRRPRG